MNGLCPASGKTRFHGRGEAKRAIHALRSGDRVRCYPCPSCGSWHLTSNTTRRTSAKSYVEARMARRRRQRRWAA